MKARPTIAPSTQELFELDDSVVFSEYEFMSLVNFVLTSPTLEPKEKEKIIKELFAGKPALLEKLLVNHPGFKALFKEKLILEKPPIVLPPSETRHVMPPSSAKPMNPTVKIKSELDWLKSPRDNIDLEARLKVSLKHEIKLTPVLLKSMIEMPAPKSPIPIPTPKAKPEIKIPSLTNEEQKKQNKAIFETLYKEFILLKTQQQTSNAAMIEANQQAEVLVQEKDAAEEMMHLIITKIHTLIASFNAHKPEKNSDGFELLKLLGHNREAAQLRFNELIQQNKANFSEDEREFFDREDVELEVKIPLYEYIETANNNGISSTMRPNLARTLSDIYNNVAFNPAQRQQLSLEHILLAMMELHQLLETVKHLPAHEAMNKYP